MEQQAEETFFGIDVSKTHLDLARWGQQEVRRYENNATGIAALVETLLYLWVYPIGFRAIRKPIVCAKMQVATRTT
jgi:hypothetical protein